MTNLIFKKYFNNNLQVLAKVYQLNKEKGFAYYSDIEDFLNRGSNQISAILGKLERDNLIKRERKVRPQKIFIQCAGENPRTISN